MEDSKKKLVMILVVVACLGIAGAVTVMRSGGTSGQTQTESVRGQMLLLKCRNCGHTFEVDKAQYYDYLKANAGPGVSPGYPCPQCKKKAAYQAIKCKNCGYIFERGVVEGEDRTTCPKCHTVNR